MNKTIRTSLKIHRFFLGTMSRALTSLVLAILLPMLLIQIVVYHQRVNVRQTEEIQSNLEMARAVSLSTEHYFRELVRAESAIGAAMTSGPISPTQAQTLLSSARREYTSVRILAWIDPQGRVIWSSQPKLRTVNMSHEPQFQAILAGQPWAVSDLISSPLNGDPIIVILRGVRDAQKQLKGVVYASINPSEMEDVAVTIRRMRQGGVTLFDRNGVLVFHSPAVDLTWEKRRTWIKVDPILDQVRSTGKEATGVFVSPADGQYRMAARVPIHGSGWVAGAGKPVSEAMAVIQRDFQYTMAMFLAAAGLSLLLAWMLSRRIVHQTQRLRDRAVALGRGEQLPPDAVPGTAELEAVSHAFDNMVRQLRRSEERFRVVFDQAYQLMGLLKPDGTLIQANQTSLSFIHQTSQEVLNRPFWDTPWWSHSEAERIRLQGSITRAARGEFIRYETTHPTPTGDLVSVDFSIKPVMDETNSVILLVVEGRDITERNRMDRELRQLTEDLEQRVHERTAALEKVVDELTRSNADLERFAYVSSHDLQEPLRMVASYVGLLEHKYKDKLDDDAREYIGYAVEGAQRMSTLIKDLLEYSRISARGQSFAPVSTERILEQVTDTLRLRIAETQAQITHDELPVVMGDESQLLQVFQNLLENALKFRREGEPPRIHIGADLRDDQWLFSIRDNGIGIEPQYHDRIFVIFQRLHARRDKYPGTGIGLAIVKRIVERHGGQVCVDSNPGHGSIFYLTLPRTSVAEELRQIAG